MYMNVQYYATMAFSCLRRRRLFFFFYRKQACMHEHVYFIIIIIISHSLRLLTVDFLSTFTHSRSLRLLLLLFSVFVSLFFTFSTRFYFMVL